MFLGGFEMFWGDIEIDQLHKMGKKNCDITIETLCPCHTSNTLEKKRQKKLIPSVNYRCVTFRFNNVSLTMEESAVTLML